MNLKEQNKTNGEGTKKRMSFWKILLINLSLMAVVIAVLLWLLSWFLASYTHHDESVKVPDLVGIPSDEAIEYLESIGLEGMAVDSVYSDARPGAVVEQTPVATLPVKNGRVVYLTVNAKTQRMVKLANVIEWSSRQALSKLREQGFIVDSVRQVPHEFDDLVLGVNFPRGGELVAGREYPYRTHVVVRVGSSHAAIVAENEEAEDAWLE